MKDAGWHVGASQRQNPYLQIPLHSEYHVGNYGVDRSAGVLSWEEIFGTQMAYLELVNSELGYMVTIFGLAGQWELENRDKATPAALRQCFG